LNLRQWLPGLAIAGTLAGLAFLLWADALWVVIAVLGALLAAGAGLLLFRLAAWQSRRRRRAAARKAEVRAAEPAEWTVAWLQQISDRRLRRLCTGFWTAKGYTVQRVERAGVDMLIRQQDDPSRTLAVIFCAPAERGPVGAVAVSALAAERDRHGASLAVYYAMGGFSADALALRSDRQLKLLSAEELLGHLAGLSTPAQQTLLKQVSRSSRNRRRRSGRSSANRP
jgi:hypothetical protein